MRLDRRLDRFQVVLGEIPVELRVDALPHRVRQRTAKFAERRRRRYEDQPVVAVGATRLFKPQSALAQEPGFLQLVEISLLDGRSFRATGEYAEGNWLAPTIWDRVRPGTEAASQLPSGRCSAS